MGHSWGEQSYFTDTVKCIHLGYFSVKRKEENKLFPVLEIQTEIFMEEMFMMSGVCFKTMQERV